MRPQPEIAQVPGGTAVRSCAGSFGAPALPPPPASGSGEPSLQDHIAAAQWHATFEAVSAAIWLLDCEGRILRANRAARLLFGQDGQEMVGRRCCEVVHGSPERLPQCPVHRLSHSLQRERLEFRQAERWLEVTVDPIFDSAGRLSAVVHIVNDITLRKNAEQALRQSRDQLAMALELAQIGTFERAIPTGLSTWSEQGFRLLGYQPGEVPPGFEAWKQRVHPQDRLRAQRETELALAGNPEHEVEYRVCWPDGSIHWLADRWRVHFDPAGQPQRILGVSMEVTERREREEALRKTNETEHQINAVLEAMVQERAAKLQAMVGEMQHLSYALIHDMRAPLRAICGYAQLLGQQCAQRLEARHQEFLERIAAATSIMDRLITDALNYDKALHQKMELAPVDAAQLLECLVDSYPQFQAHRPHIRIEGPFPLVLANEAGLAQCLAHLLDNALKFIPPQTTPRIRLRAETISGGAAPAETRSPLSCQLSPAVRLWVEDNGVGIDKQFQTRIFDLFQRGSNYQEGTGLGLALVRKITEQMRGRVGVESEPGQGSRFWLELQPASEPAPPARNAI